jgi:hypothetical protein
VRRSRVGPPRWEFLGAVTSHLIMGTKAPAAWRAEAVCKHTLSISHGLTLTHTHTHTLTPPLTDSLTFAHIHTTQVDVTWDCNESATCFRHLQLSFGQDGAAFGRHFSTFRSCIPQRSSRRGRRPCAMTASIITWISDEAFK